MKKIDKQWWDYHSNIFFIYQRRLWKRQMVSKKPFVLLSFWKPCNKEGAKTEILNQLSSKGGYHGLCPNLHDLVLTQKLRHQLCHLVYCLYHLHQQVWFQMSSSMAIQAERLPAWLLSHLSRACLHSFVCTALRN